MKLDMSTFKRKIYASIMTRGINVVTECACNISDADETVKPMLTNMVAAHFEDRFMDPKMFLLPQISEQFSEAAYHFQKLSNVAEELAENKLQFCLESGVAPSDEMTELSDEENDLVNSVINDAPDTLIDSIAAKVASALAADQRRAEAIQQSLTLMKQDGATPEVLEAVTNEAAAMPATLLSAVAMYQGSQHISCAMTEGSGFQDPDSIVRLNAENIRNTALVTYAMFETFNVIKPYKKEEIKDLIFSFQNNNFKK